MSEGWGQGMLYKAHVPYWEGTWRGKDHFVTDCLIVHLAICCASCTIFRSISDSMWFQSIFQVACEDNRTQTREKPPERACQKVSRLTDLTWMWIDVFPPIKAEGVSPCQADASVNSDLLSLHWFNAKYKGADYVVCVWGQRGLKIMHAMWLRCHNDAAYGVHNVSYMWHARVCVSEGDKAAVFRTTQVRTKLRGDGSWLQRRSEPQAETKEEKPW